MTKRRKFTLENEIERLLVDGYNNADTYVPAIIPKLYTVECEKQSIEEPEFKRDIVYTLRFVIEKQIRVPEENKEAFDLVRKTLTSEILNEIYGEVMRELVGLDYNFIKVIGKYGRDNDIIEIYDKVQELIKLMTVER